MREKGRSRLNTAELNRRLRAVDPSAFLLAPRLVRRVLRHHRGLTGWMVQVPRRKVLLLPGPVLQRLVHRHELRLEPQGRVPAQVLVMRAPEAAWLARQAPERVLHRFWRQLFHAHVLAAIERRNFNQAQVRERVAALGQTAFDEIRGVLQGEGYLLPIESDLSVYATFAAVFFELRCFAADELPAFFPNLAEHDRWEKLLRRDLDVEGLLDRTQLHGAPAQMGGLRESSVVEGRKPDSSGPTDPQVRAGVREKLLERAVHSATIGNVVRAAIQRTRAAELSEPGAAAQLRTEADAQIRRLVERLNSALGLPVGEDEQWRRLLTALLPRTLRHSWTQEGRFLYDLQKVCVDHERGIRETSIIRWAKSLGKAPVDRPMPLLQEVLLTGHLRRAGKRLPKLRLSEADWRDLDALMRREVQRGEGRLRSRLRPILEQEIRSAGIEGESTPERVGIERITDELLDRLVEQGSLSMSQVRDAISRNEVKLPRCDRPASFFLDRLLKLNRGLKRSLEGVYRPGEFYLRWLHRFSALLFGTHIGRWLSLFVLLPFGGAWVAMTGLHRSVSHPPHEEAAKTDLQGDAGMAGAGAEIDGTPPDGGPAPDPKVDEAIRELESSGFKVERVPEGAAHSAQDAGLGDSFGAQLDANLELYTAVLGAFILGLLFIPDVRRGIWNGLRVVGRSIKRVFHDWPAALLALPPVRRFLASRPVLLIKHFALKPAMVAGATLSPLLLTGPTLEEIFWTGLIGYGVCAIFLNTAPGLALIEITGDLASRTWDRVKSQFLVGVFRWFVDVFAGLMGAIERGLYQVDEWLRFRVGESRRTLWIKASLGFVWSGVSYLIRFYVVLLIEPQVNPIKHFPVVTVSHKLILPALPALTQWIVDIISPITGEVLAWGIAGANIFLLPGVFGFLAWELKENWRLFGINRAPDLRPQIIGSHGETMTRFLKPGFHSGTLPKAYRRLRRAGLEPAGTDRSGPRHWREVIHHVEVAVEDFVERDLVRLLESSPGWRRFPVYVGRVQARSNCIYVELAGGSGERGPLRIGFEEQNGLLVAGIMGRGWLPELEFGQRRVLRNALVGLYHHAGVALVREEIEARLGKPTPAYDISRQGLVVWPGPGYEQEIVYDLETGVGRSTEGEAARPTEGLTEGSLLPRRSRDLRTFSLRFDRTRVPWESWLEVWEDDLDPHLEPREIGVGRILPTGAPPIAARVAGQLQGGALQSGADGQNAPSGDLLDDDRAGGLGGSRGT